MESKIKNPEWQMVAEVELVYRNSIRPSDRPQITSEKDAFEVLLQSWNEDKIELIEQFKVLLLNTSNRVLGVFEVSTGGVSSTVADPKVIFAAALKGHASGIILSHNHPSGNLKPSLADINLTQKISEGCNLLDIKLLDHIILTQEGYFSMKGEGVI